MSTSSVLQVVAVLLSLGASVWATIVAARASRPDVSWPDVRLRWVIYLWPVAAIAPLVVTIFVWSPRPANFPSLEFYRVAAEVMPLLLIALLVEQTFVKNVPYGIRVEFTVVLLAAEIAAFVGLSEIFGNSPYVGGSSGATA